MVQLERITFRAVLIFLGTALFVCSESDTFLMNFNTKYKWCVEKEIYRAYLLQDELEENEISTIREIEALWKDISPSKQALAFAMIKAVLEHKE